MKYVDGRPTSTVTDTEILGFFGKYRFLSNFHFAKFTLDDTVYPSSEHAYMAQKTLVPIEKGYFTLFAGLSVVDAKKLGQQITLREDWEKIKVSEMKRVLLAKFTQNYYLGELLLDTGSLRLEETNYWNDTFWGICKGVGENMLGKLLMEVREELRG